MATVQATQLAKFFTSVFSTKAADNNDDSHLNPLNRLLSLFVFTPKFTKAHLNTSFQNVDLELGTIYKSTLINPFQYAPQTNRVMVKAVSSKLEEECNELNWRITNKDKKQVTAVIEGVGQIDSMEDVCMTCANMCGVQLAIVDVSKSKPLLYQFAWKIIKFIEKKKTKTWLRNNRDSIAHLPMVFMSKIHQFFQHLANFSQNSLNTNKVKVGNSAFETKLVKTGVKLGAKIFNKMIEHVKDNLLPKDIHTFAKSKGTPAAKALPNKGKLKDEVCLDFCLHEKKCNYPQQLCKHRKHYANWKNVPKEDKPALLSHMNEMGLMWLDSKTFEKQKQM